MTNDPEQPDDNEPENDQGTAQPNAMKQGGPLPDTKKPTGPLTDAKKQEV